MTQGRWMVPDPFGAGAVNMGDPQSWNRYAYVGNSPLSYVDPLGLFLITCSSRRGGGLVCLDSVGDGLAGMGFGPDTITLIAGDNAGLPGSFSFFGGGLCGSDFLPCGLPVPSLGQTIWNDVLGLPPIPTWADVLNPIMDAEAANYGTNCTPLSPGCSNVPTLKQWKQHQCQQAMAAANQASNELEKANVATLKRAGLAFGGGCLWGMATGEVVETPVAGTGLAPGSCLVGGIAAGGATVFGEIAYESKTWWNAGAADVRAIEACVE